MSATRVAKMSNKKSILIVDDDEVVRRSYLRSLESTSCNFEALQAEELREKHCGKGD
jgi:ActR/RegA family two-component response regulator